MRMLRIVLLGLALSSVDKVGFAESSPPETVPPSQKDSPNMAPTGAVIRNCEIKGVGHNVKDRKTCAKRGGLWFEQAKAPVNDGPGMGPTDNSKPLPSK